MDTSGAGGGSAAWPLGTEPAPHSLLSKQNLPGQGLPGQGGTHPVPTAGTLAFSEISSRARASREDRPHSEWTTGGEALGKIKGGGKLETVTSGFDSVHITSVTTRRGDPLPRHTLSRPAGRVTAVCTSCHYKEAVSQR